MSTVLLSGMQVKVYPKTYVAAISGGVDSVVLLDILTQQPTVQLAVAHFDHGMRADSAADRQFVASLAQQHKVPFLYDEGNLGADASEAAARHARYAFLRRAKQASGAAVIVTAHHQDDFLETAIINLLRGTGPRGLTALKSTGEIYRPLLDTPKSHLIAYAKNNGLEWREDSTNTDTNYLRNHVRHNIIAKFDAPSRQKFLDIIQQTERLNHYIDTLLVNLLHEQPSSLGLDRLQFIMLPHAVARELMAAWLRAHGLRSFDRKTIERAVSFAKTAATGKHLQLSKCFDLRADRNILALTISDR